MDPLVSTNDSECGFLGISPAWQVLILFQVGLEVEAELRHLNHLISYQQEVEMREIRDMAAGMKEAVAKLRQDASNAKVEFQSEFTRAQTNTEKFKSFTTELKEANKEVESFLGETGSNFPTSEASPTPDVHVDRHGVPFTNGVVLNGAAK